ncbi:MAG: winged helix-turn-helix domain-containing protein [Promethearchaeia archaeon]
MQKKKKNESLEDLKYILGNMGVEIFRAIDKGATSIKTINLFSGVSLRCIRGRLPVLLDLKLIKKRNKKYFISKKGRKFRDKINKKRNKC